MHSAGQIRDRVRLLGRELRLAETVAQARPDLAHPEVLLFAGSDLPTSIDQLFVAPAVITDGFTVPGKPLPKFDLPRLALFQEQAPIEAPSAFNTEVCDESDPAAAMFEPNFADVAPMGEPLDQTRQIEEPVVAEKMELAGDDDYTALDILLKSIGMRRESFPYYNEKYLWLIVQLQRFTEPTGAMTPTERAAFWQVLLNHLPLSSQAPQALEIGFGGVYANIFALLDLGVEVTATELHRSFVADLERSGGEHEGTLHVLTSDDFADQNLSNPRQFQLVVLNMPLPKDELVGEFTDVIELQTAPGGFVVFSTDVPFMYLEHFWTALDRWEPIMMDHEEVLATRAILPSRQLRHGDGILAVFRRLPVPPERVVSGEMPEDALASIQQTNILQRMWLGFLNLFAAPATEKNVPEAVNSAEASFPVDEALTEALVLAEEVRDILRSRPGLERILEAYDPRVNSLVASLGYLSNSRHRSELAPENLAGLISRLREFVIKAYDEGSDAELLEYYALESLEPDFCDQEYGDTLAKDVDSWRKMAYAIRQYYRP